MGFDEGLLERVLALVAIAEHVPAVRQQRPVVALEDRGEGSLIARLHAHDERRVVVAKASAVVLRIRDAVQ